MPFRRWLVALAVFVLLGARSPVGAAEIHVAVAANFAEPAKQIAEAFAKSSGHTAVLSFGASGQFYTQIRQGAPYEVFLSADAERPQQAERTGLAVAGSRFTYAQGRLVLFSRTVALVDEAGSVLKTGKFDKLAIADPAAAPYGAAAVEFLQRLGVHDTVKPKLVTGQSITQALQFVATGAAELGLVALSQVIAEPGGSRWLVPRAYHGAIEQQAVLLKRGEQSDAARAFLAFLRGPEALAIIKTFGYEAD